MKVELGERVYAAAELRDKSTPDFDGFLNIPDPSLQTYFMLVLFTIWSVFFGFLAANYLGFFNYNTVISIIIHVAILLPLAFTNAIFIDAERDGHNWLKEWKEEQNRYTIVANRLKRKNLTIWDPSKEA